MLLDEEDVEQFAIPTIFEKFAYAEVTLDHVHVLVVGVQSSSTKLFGSALVVKVIADELV